MDVLQLSQTNSECPDDDLPTVDLSDDEALSTSHQSLPTKQICTLPLSDSWQHLENKIYFHAEVEGEPHEILLDTGAQSCVVGQDVFQQLPDADNLPIHDDNHILLDSNNQELKQVTSPRLIRFTLNGQDFHHPVHVIANKIKSFFLVGACFMNFLQLSILNFGPNNIRLKLGDPTKDSPLIPTFDSRSKIDATKPTELVLHHTQVVEPLATVSVECHTANPTSFVADICPHDANELSPLRLMTSLQHVRDSTKIKITNQSTEPLLLSEGMAIATAVPLSKDLHNIDKTLPTEISEATLVDFEIDAPGLEFPAQEKKFNIRDYLRADPLFDQNHMEKLVAIFDAVPGVIAESEFDIGDTTPLGIEMELVTTTEEPIQCQPYKLDEIRTQQLEKLLDRLAERGIMAKEPSNFASPAFVVVRRGEHQAGAKLRLVINYKRLNSVTIKDCEPLPHISTLLNKVRGSTFFTSLDVKSAFLAVPMSASASKKAAIVTSKSLYVPKRAMMGLSNSPATFTRVINKALAGLPRVLVYMDDILILGRGSLEEHLADIKETLLCLRSAGLKINGKGSFLRREIRFLGKIITQDGMRPLPSHTNALHDFPTPRSAKQVQKFLGLVAWLAPFLKNYASKIEPFTALLNDTTFTWSDELQTCFDNLKAEVTETSFQYFVDFTAPLYLAVDASQHNFAGMLYQTVAYSKEDLPKLQAAAGYPDKFPTSTVETNHPVVPPAGRGVPKTFPLQADEDSPFQTASHLIAAVNKTAPDLTTIMKDPTTVFHVRLCGMYSGIFKGAMKHYSSLEQEAVALTLAVEHFAEFLRHAPVTYLITDSQSLLWLLKLRNSNISKIERLLIRLMSLPFKVIVSHLRGEHHPADLMTRFYYVPPTHRLTEAKQAIVISTPFPPASIVTKEDILKALRDNPDIVSIPDPPSKQIVNCVHTFKSIHSCTYANISNDIHQSISPAAMAEEQEKDRDLKLLRHQLMSGESVDGYTMQKGLLRKVPKESSQLIPQQSSSLHPVVVPPVLIPLVLAFFHLGSHAGAKALEGMIRPLFYFKNIRKLASAFSSACALCLAYKADTSPKIELGIAPLPARKLTVFHLDIVTGLPSVQGLDAYLTILDPYSSFRMAIPIRSTITAKGIAAILNLHVVQRFGPPSILVSDGGPQLLRSTELKNYCSFFGIRGIVQSPNVPRAHGRVEIQNRNITQTTIMLSEQYDKPWPSMLSLAVYTLNCRPRRFFQGLSPLEICFGIAPNVPAPYRQPDVDNLDPAEVRRLWADLHNKCDALIRDAYLQMVKINKSKGGYLPHIKPGSFVYLRNFKIAPKKKVQRKFVSAPFLVRHDFGHALLVSSFSGILQQVHKSNVRIVPPREVELFERLPAKIKVILGPPYTAADIAKAVEERKIPTFWQERTPPPSPPITRQQAREAAQAEAAEAALPHLPDSDSDSDDGEPVSGHVPRSHSLPRSVRFNV